MPRAAPETAIHHVHLVLSISYCFERPPSFTCADPTAMSRFVQKLKKKPGDFIASLNCYHECHSSATRIFCIIPFLRSFHRASNRASTAAHTWLAVPPARVSCLSSPILSTIFWNIAMSGFVKRAKHRVGLLVDNLRSKPPVPPASKLDQSESSEHGYPYARPRAPPTAGETASSAIIELLAAAHNGSDLCLPLKAALVVVVKVWDICKVCSTCRLRLL